LSKNQFEFPLGIRLWNRSSVRRPLRLHEGYEFSLLENSKDSYRFTAIASPEKIAPLFRSFSRALSDEAFFILEFYQEDPPSLPTEEPPIPNVFYSPYLPTNEIVDTLEEYFPRLIHDGFVGFGLANNREGMELFYSEEKVLTCFTSNHIRVMDLFALHGLSHRKKLVFPTDMGHDHLSLLCHNRNVLPEPFASMEEKDLDYSNPTSVPRFPNFSTCTPLRRASLSSSPRRNRIS